jgi:hypothetical protein
MKRSRQVVLVLSGALASGGLTGCQPDPPPPVVSADNTYTNNHYVSGAGYYHAPYRAWYPFPYNHHDPAQGYYYGGRWNQQPERPTVAASRPTPQSAQLINSKVAPPKSSSGSTTSRGGFGRSWFSGGS